MDGNILEIMEMMAKAMELHNDYLSIFSTVTVDDFLTCKQHYTDFEGSGPDERDCDVSNSLEAEVLEELGCILLKSFSNIMVMPTDATTLPAIKDAHEYMNDKVEIFTKSSSMEEYMDNFRKYFKDLLG